MNIKTKYCKRGSSAPHGNILVSCGSFLNSDKTSKYDHGLQHFVTIKISHQSHHTYFSLNNLLRIEQFVHIHSIKVKTCEVGGKTTLSKPHALHANVVC